MHKHERLLLENKAWVQDRTESDQDFFTRMAKSQAPEFLWIGCSDSRVSPSEITQTEPGEIFIHRNIANLVVHSDLNLLSVVQYAVEVLGVGHVIVCGHYGCGGVKAAMGRTSLGTIDTWLRHIKDVYRLHQQEIDALEGEEKTNRLVERNVAEQVMNLAKTSLIQKTWKTHRRPMLHGWVYDMSDGILKPLLKLTPETALEHSFYQYDNL